MTELAESRSPWCIPWQCLHEFIAIVTHPRIYSPPSRLAQAIDQIDAWLESPSVVLLAETDGYWQTLKSQLEEGRVTGPMVHDARVAAVCLLHGVRELWTADRDFGRFAELTVRNPLVA
jgi:predicted nucleic acid-binding protein